MADIDFFHALRSFDYDTVSRHIREGQDVNENRPLLLVLMSGPQNRGERNNQLKIIQLLVQNGTDLELEWERERDADDMLSNLTYLMWTVRSNSRHLTKLLLDLGANPNHVALGCSVLEYVLSTNFEVDYAELLLMYGADPRQVRFGKYIDGFGYAIETFANLPDHLQNLIDRYNELIRTGAMGEINKLTTTGPDSQKRFIHRAIQRAMALDNDEGFVDLTPEEDQENILNIFQEAKLLQWTPQTNKHFLPSFRRRVFTSVLQAQRQTKDYTQLPPELYHKILSISSEQKDVDVSTLASFINRPAIVF